MSRPGEIHTSQALQKGLLSYNLQIFSWDRLIANIYVIVSVRRHASSPQRAARRSKLSPMIL